MNLSKEFIYGIPKAELHLHLEGTLEADLKLELSKKNGVDIGQTTIEEVKESYKFNDLSSFLAVYYPAMNVLQTRDDFYKLAMDYLKKASENNVVYAELFFDPQAHTSRGVAFEEVIEGYYKATQEGKALGIESKLIMCFRRDMSAESALEHYEMMLPYRDKVIGIGLDSDERDNPPMKFEHVFSLAKKAGFKTTMHCDIDQVDSIEHIRDAIKTIGVDRIDHGTNIVEDPTLVEYIIDNKIGLTCCPVSNGL
jgi:adenosine deaminase